ncbi:MAG TPA: histidine triad nucleotide-binding protein [Thermoleophilia bacterium]|nr:histidine triad nucleotide-binding protein [Thermoleophilia bacterium]
MGHCIFCKIIGGEIPGDVVLEDEEFFAIRDISPKAAQHVLVMPREHVESLNEVGVWTDGRGQRLLAFTARVAADLGIARSGYRVITNVGPDGGQEVDHLHFHVLGGERLGDLV